MTQSRPGQKVDPSQPWIAEAAEYFSRGGNNGLPWPVGSIVISEKHKLLFAPIAKCACSSLKTMMVNLAQPEFASKIIKLGVHQVTDRFNTGMQLKDLPKTHALNILKSNEYYKFAVIRDPVKRAISAYTEKFVLNRMNVGNRLHTGPVIKAVQHRELPDFEQGISFRQFVEFITSQAPNSLDPHWIPQCYFLRGVPKYNRIFRVDQLKELKVSLESWTGVSIKLGQLNTSLQPRKKGTITCPYEPKNVIDLLPEELLKIPNLNSKIFKDQNLVGQLEKYYAEDYILYQSTFNSGADYKPETMDLCKLTNPLVGNRTGTKSNTWQLINVYTKGFLGLHNSGSGSTGVVIINSSSSPVSSAQFPGLRLEYSILDCNGQSLSAGLTTILATETIPAKGSLQINVEIKLDTHLLSQARRIQLSLASDTEENGFSNSLAHCASAEVIQTDD